MSRLRQAGAPSRVLLFAERAVYYVAALGLIAAAGAMFVVMTIDVVRGLTGGLTQTIVTVLGRMLLAFILLELAHSIRIVLQEQTLVAEPFLLIGLIAVVRRILILTAQAERLPLKGESVNDLVLELAVLTALVIALAAALYMLYPPGRRADPLLESGDAPSGG